MKRNYRGHEITVFRDQSLGGDVYLYYTIIRLSDGYICVDNFTSGAETVREFMGHMKERVDNELQEDDPWGEAEEEAKFLGFLGGVG